MTAPTRRLVIADTETSGLRPIDVVVEVAWHDVDTDQRGVFVPPHDVDWVLEHGEPEALEMNGYRERLAGAPQDHGGTHARAMRRALIGQCLAGANPAFDAARLGPVFARADMTVLPSSSPPWHHRLADIESYAAGALGIDPRDLPGLRTVCELLGVQPGDHTAAGDVRAAAECFVALGRRAAAPESWGPRQWLDDQLVDRAGAWIHSAVSSSPWSSLTPTAQVLRRNQASGVLKLADGSMVTFPGDPGPAPAPADADGPTS